MQPSKPNNIIAFGLRSMATAHLAKLDDRCTVLRGILLEQHPGVTKQAIASEIVGVLYQRGVICKSLARSIIQDILSLDSCFRRNDVRDDDDGGGS